MGEPGFDVHAMSTLVSVVVCVRNGESMIGEGLRRILANRPREVIVVDGCSTDGTLRILHEFGPAVRVLSDEGGGLACARRIGGEAASGRYVLFSAPDNLMPPTFVADFVRVMEEWGFDAASVQTRVENPSTYWDRTIDWRWQCLMGTPGPVNVVGTPSLYRRDMLERIGFDDRVHAADDTDLSERLRAAGYKLGLIPLGVYEHGGMSLAYVWPRFRLYGSSDHSFYAKYAPGWTLGRKLFSVTHPWRQTWRYAVSAVRKGQARYVPGLVVLMLARYWGWLRELGKPPMPQRRGTAGAAR